MEQFAEIPLDGVVLKVKILEGESIEGMSFVKRIEGRSDRGNLL